MNMINERILITTHFSELLQYVEDVINSDQRILDLQYTHIICKISS